MAERTKEHSEGIRSEDPNLEEGQERDSRMSNLSELSGEAGQSPASSPRDSRQWFPRKPVPGLGNELPTHWEQDRPEHVIEAE